MDGWREKAPPSVHPCLMQSEAVFKVKLHSENERECCLQGARSSRSASYGDAAER